ncbi:MAG: hypothetical protein LBM59_05290 [Ruminococcus sp.]|jgi:hypothetical protein|nr:hypothetical protein [Ruminococcus sp.]
MEDMNMAELTLRMYEDNIKNTRANFKLALHNKILALKEAGKSKGEILDTIEAELSI